VLRESHDGRVVVGSADFADADLEELLEGAGHADGSLISNGEDSLLLSAVLEHVISDVSDNTRVDTAAHTLVGGDSNDEFLTDSGSVRCSILHVLIRSEHHINR